MTDEVIAAAPQPSGFSANFTIKIDGLRTATIGDKVGVVKQVDWTITGEEADQFFSLPQTTQLPDPDSLPFIPFNKLTEIEVITWIEEEETRLPGIKAHIQYVLDREIAKASLEPTTMPWAHVAEVPSIELAVE